MAFFNRNGVWFTVDGDISDVEDLIHKALLDVSHMKDRHPGLDIMEFERPREYKVRSIHGRDTVEIAQEYVEERARRKLEWELDLSNLVIGYEVAYGSTLEGFYISTTFPEPRSRENGEWPPGFNYHEDDPDLPSYPAWDNGIRWAQGLTPIYRILSLYPGDWTWELHPIYPVATDKTDKVDDDKSSDDSVSDTYWVPGLPEDHGINPWIDGPKAIAYAKTLYGPNVSGTFWWNDGYWSPVCIQDSQDGIYINDTLWEFWWPPRTYNENVSNLAVTAPTVISASDPPFYWFKGRSGFYTDYHDSSNFCLKDHTDWTEICNPCSPEWMWPSDGNQERWWSDNDKRFTEILFTDGPSCWLAEFLKDVSTYQYWSGVWENVSYKDYTRSDVGDSPWHYDPWCPAAATWNEEDYGNYEVWGVFVLNYNYDYRCTSRVSPYDANVTECNPVPIPYTYQLVFLCSHWPTPIVCYEQYLETYDEPEPKGIQCDFWNYGGEPIIFFSFQAYEPTDPQDPDYSDKYIQHAIIYKGNIHWSEKKTAYGTTHPYYNVWKNDVVGGEYMGQCYGFARPFTIREHKEDMIEIMEGV